MLRSLTVVLSAALAASPLGAAVWPEQAGSFKKLASAPANPPDKAIFAEYGFEQGEQATFQSAGTSIRATAYRFKDATGAFAACQSLSASDPGGVVQVGNYVVWYPGAAKSPDLAAAIAHSPGVDRSPLPTLPHYLPEKGLVAGSERYILGPEGLARFAPQVPAQAAAFEFGTEGEVAQYRLPGGTVSLALFSYPNPQIALKQFGEFLKAPGLMAKRTGPLVAVVVAPRDADDAERLLASVRYNAEVTWNEKPEDPKNNVADVLLNIFILTGILICLFTAAGVMVGLIRRWATADKAGDPMILLHLDK